MLRRQNLACLLIDRVQLLWILSKKFQKVCAPHLRTVLGFHLNYEQIENSEMLKQPLTISFMRNMPHDDGTRFHCYVPQREKETKHVISHVRELLILTCKLACWHNNSPNDMLKGTFSFITFQGIIKTAI